MPNAAAFSTLKINPTSDIRSIFIAAVSATFPVAAAAYPLGGAAIRETAAKPTAVIPSSRFTNN